MYKEIFTKIELMKNNVIVVLESVNTETVIIIALAIIIGMMMVRNSKLRQKIKGNETLNYVVPLIQLCAIMICVIPVVELLTNPKQFIQNIEKAPLITFIAMIIIIYGCSVETGLKEIFKREQTPNLNKKHKTKIFK